MSSAKITLFTFARYMQQHEDDLFKNLTVPTGLNKDTLTENILLRGGEFEVIYSDPLFMQYAIGTWSRKWQRTMEKWLQALAIDYNPLENYDRYENIQDKNNKTSNMDRTLDHQDATVINTQDLRTLDTQDLRTLDTEDLRTLNTQELRTLDTENKRTLDTDTLSTRNLMDEETRNLTDEETRLMNDTTTYDHDTEVERRVSAFDSSSYQPAEVTYNKDSDSDHNTVSIDYSGTDTFEHTGKDVFNHTGTEDNKQTGTDTMNNTGTDTLNNTGTDTTGHTGTDTMDHTGTDTMNRTGTETTGHTGTISDAGGEDSFNDHIGHIHGNIGVTSSQDLLSQELSIDEWNIYEHITDLFLTEFVIPIYT